MSTAIHIRKLRNPRSGVTVAASLLLAVVAWPAAAETSPSTTPKASKKESIGVAGGFALGAAAGGPVGALVGAAAGGWLGDRMHREQAGHALTREQLAVAESRGDGLTLNLMFRTEEARLRVDDEPLLLQFADVARKTPGATVHVTGFADPRGTVRYNSALAAERAQGVATRLVEAGVPPDRLVVSAEVAAAQPAAPPRVEDVDGHAFQRRVTLRLQVTPVKGGDASGGALAQRR